MDARLKLRTIRQLSENCLGLLSEGLGFNLASAHQNDIRANVVGLVEFHYVIILNLINVFPDAQYRLRNEMIPKGSVVNSFQSRLHLILMVFNANPINFILLGFDLILIIDRIEKYIS